MTADDVEAWRSSAVIDRRYSSMRRLRGIFLRFIHTLIDRRYNWER